MTPTLTLLPALASCFRRGGEDSAARFSTFTVSAGRAGGGNGLEETGWKSRASTAPSWAAPPLCPLPGCEDSPGGNREVNQPVLCLTENGRNASA